MGRKRGNKNKSGDTEGGSQGTQPASSQQGPQGDQSTQRAGSSQQQRGQQAEGGRDQRGQQQQSEQHDQARGREQQQQLGGAGQQSGGRGGGRGQGRQQSGGRGQSEQQQQPGQHGQGRGGGRGGGQGQRGRPGQGQSQQSPQHQQQPGGGQPQQESGWGQQQIGRGQQQPGRGQSQQQSGRGQPQQPGWGQQQPGRGQPQQQPGWGQPQQQPGGGQPQQQPAWGQQQPGRGQPHQQPGWGQPQQQPGGGQPQQQPAWGQQPGRGEPPQQQPGWGQAQQPGGGQAQQQPGRGQPGVGQQPGRGQPQQPGRGQGPPQQGRSQGPAQQTAPHQPRQSGDQRKPEKSVQDVTKQMQRMRLDEGDETLVSQTEIVSGQKGRRIPVEANYVALNIGNLKEAYHYHVDITPIASRKNIPEIMKMFVQKNFPGRAPAFDGRVNLYTPQLLDRDTNKTFQDDIMLANSRRPFHVVVSFANAVDLTGLQNCLKQKATPRDALQAVNIVLRAPAVANGFAVGRSFFSYATPNRFNLDGGLEMRTGLYQSAVRCSRLLLNIDVANKVFYAPMKVTDLKNQYFSDPRGQYRPEEFGSFMTGVRVQYKFKDNEWKEVTVRGVGKPAGQAMFTNSDGQEISVADYFARCKNTQVDPRLLTLRVGSTIVSQQVLLPMDVCYISDHQVMTKQLGDVQVRNMIRQTATSVEIRKKKIIENFKSINYNANPTFREFGFNIQPGFQKLEARVLQPPMLQYGNQRMAKVFKGTWRTEDQFLVPVNISKWTIMVVDRRPYGDALDNFKRLLISTSRNVGCVLASPVEPFNVIPANYNAILKYFQEKQKANMDVIFVIIPNFGPGYSFVKKAAEVMTGCLTQCVKVGTMQGNKLNPQTVSNILLKVNSKLNGVTHVLCQRDKPPILNNAMLMGADVTHPAPNSTLIPSVAAVTASHDLDGFKYNICWRLQEPTLEIIGDLEEITVEQLKHYYSNTKSYPSTILFFRDGVSEGQFAEVVRKEVEAIKRACRRVFPNKNAPKITFVVVQKRHHTRLFPMNPRDSEDRNGNVPAGTCVDKDITHPFMQDFYLVSHASIQGVAKPTKYCTLYDDNKLSNDTIEHVAFYLCHLFTRCTRSVSYPAPTYYAHLAAARAKVYIENEPNVLANLQRVMETYKIKENIQKGKPMFFV